MIRRTRLFAAALLLATAGTAFAHSGASGIVKERMDLMKGLGAAMKTLAAVFRGEAEHDPAVIREAARTIRAGGGEHMTGLFPEGSLDAPTEALPAIWEDWAAFRRYADDMETYGAALEAAADNEPGPMHGGRRPMMGGGAMMGRGPMMGGGGPGAGRPMDDPEALRAMPPMASFMRLSETCNACHTRFRVKK